MGRTPATTPRSVGVVLAATLLSSLLTMPVAADELCGTITTDTVLTEEWLACSSLSVVGDDIVVDLAGLTFGGVHIEGSGITVRNGTFDGTVRPGEVDVWAASTEDLLLEHLTVENSTASWAATTGWRTTVRNSVFRGNAFAALEQFYGDELTAQGNTFQDNGRGIAIQDGRDAHIVGNRFVGNGIGVHVWDEEEVGASGTRISSNRFDRNGFAIRIEGLADARDTVIEKNTIRRSEASGIAVTTDETSLGAPAAQGTVIRENVIGHSGSSPQEVEACGFDEMDGYPNVVCDSRTANDGITILLGNRAIAPTITVTANRTPKNAGHGIYAPDVTDGGKNVAPANGADPACVGVSCRRGGRP